MRALLLFTFCCITITSNSQTQYAGWLATFNTFKTGKKMSIHNDIQWRSTDELRHTQTFLFRVGLNYKINKLMTVTGGYAFVHNRRTVSSVTGFAPEHRIWEQLLIPQKWKRLLITHRFRLEQRFVSKSAVVNNELENTGSAYSNRFRYFLRNILPLRKEAKFERGPFLALQNEVFLNFGNRANVNGKYFDQNRFYLAAGYRVDAKLDIELGFLNQYIHGRTNDVSNQALQVATYVRL